MLYLEAWSLSLQSEMARDVTHANSLIYNNSTKGKLHWQSLDFGPYVILVLSNFNLLNFDINLWFCLNLVQLL